MLEGASPLFRCLASRCAATTMSKRQDCNERRDIFFFNDGGLQREICFFLKEREREVEDSLIADFLRKNNFNGSMFDNVCLKFSNYLDMIQYLLLVKVIRFLKSYAIRELNEKLLISILWQFDM